MCPKFNEHARTWSIWYCFMPGRTSAVSSTSYGPRVTMLLYVHTFFSLFFFRSLHFYFPASGQAVVTGVAPFSPRFLPLIFIPHRVWQSHCTSIFHRVLLTHALALSASQFVHKKKSQRIYTSMHSAGLELTKLTHTRLEDNLIRHRGDRLCIPGRLYQVPAINSRRGSKKEPHDNSHGGVISSTAVTPWSQPLRIEPPNPSLY